MGICKTSDPIQIDIQNPSPEALVSSKPKVRTQRECILELKLKKGLVYGQW